MKNFKITYEYISHDKEGIAYEDLPAFSCEDAIKRFNEKGLGLTEFIQRFGTEDQCEKQLALLKWGHGFSCPRCESKDYSTFRRNDRPYF